MISAGGQEIVEAGGVARGVTVKAGGLIPGRRRRAITSGLTIAGGKAVIAGTVATGQTIGFTGTAAVLELDNLAGFHAAISGLNLATQKLDLGGFAFSSGEMATWTQSGTSGTLTVHDGAKTASLKLIGTYVTSDFQLASDGHGGTFVADPAADAPTSDPAPVRFVAAVAGLDSGRGLPGGGAGHAAGTTLIGVAPLPTAVGSGR